jgi:formiminotetrahydrofolate cyclodeaminase
MHLHTTSLKPWLNALAAKSSTPGGGNVAAVLGAQASALTSMVCRFSSDARIDEQLIKELDRTRDQFLTLADADSAAFDELMLSYKTPKTDPLRA